MAKQPTKATDSEIEAEERATDAADLAKDTADAVAAAHPEELAAQARAQDAKSYAEKLARMADPVSLGDQLAEHIGRVGLIIEAYDSNDRAHVLRDAIEKDLNDAKAALTSGDEARQEMAVAILSAHRL